MFILDIPHLFFSLLLPFSFYNFYYIIFAFVLILIRNGFSNPCCPSLKFSRSGFFVLLSLSLYVLFSLCIYPYSFFSLLGDFLFLLFASFALWDLLTNYKNEFLGHYPYILFFILLILLFYLTPLWTTGAYSPFIKFFSAYYSNTNVLSYLIVSFSGLYVFLLSRCQSLNPRQKRRYRLLIFLLTASILLLMLTKTAIAVFFLFYGLHVLIGVAHQRFIAVFILSLSLALLSSTVFDFSSTFRTAHSSSSPTFPNQESISIFVKRNITVSSFAYPVISAYRSSNFISLFKFNPDSSFNQEYRIIPHSFLFSLPHIIPLLGYPIFFLFCYLSLSFACIDPYLALASSSFFIACLITPFPVPVLSVMLTLALKLSGTDFLSKSFDFSL